MTKSEALFIKYLRVRLECSWRKVYAHWHNRYVHKIPFSNYETVANQIWGRQLCRDAQTLLNENWEDEY